MTVGEVKAYLGKVDNDTELVVAVRTHAQRHSVAHVSPFDFSRAFTGAALWISLPDNMHTVTRKEPRKEVR